jgi:hypothetical protein
VYREFRLDPAPLVEGAAVTAALLLAEHLALWQARGRLPLPARYTLGTLALLAGLAHTCHRRGDTRPAVEAAAIAACGGSVVIAAHLVRAWRWKQQERHLDGLYRKSNALRA